LKLGVDTNVLVYAHMPALKQHERVRQFILAELRKPDVNLVITPLVLHEFVHVITDARRFEPPVPISEAIAVARLYVGRANVDCASVTEAVLIDTFRLLEEHHLGRKRIADTLLVATLLRHGVHRLLTCNPSDFASFAGLELIDPRLEG
jgi:toxin-antitoxin system PIN domain toxin